MYDRNYYCYLVGDIKGTALPINYIIKHVLYTCIILTVQYQQKLSADMVECQRTARCRPRSNNKPFNVSNTCF